MSDHEYVDERNYITYGDPDNKLVFIRRCPHCSKFVKAHDSITTTGAGLKNEPTAVCKVHGEVQMPFWATFEGCDYERPSPTRTKVATNQKHGRTPNDSTNNQE